MPSSKQNENYVCFMVGSSCGLLYLILQILSNQDTGIGVAHFLAIHFATSFILFTYWWYLHRTSQTISMVLVLVWAMVFRVIGVFGSPVLEDDFYRYLLDGCVFFEMGSPYGIPPQSLFSNSSLPQECQEALIWVNHPHLPTIYSPVLQYVFAIAHWISPGNITVLQGILCLFDLLLIYCLLRLGNPNHVMLYAWCPLIIKEIAFTAHPDIVGICFIFLAIVALDSRRQMFTAVFCGLALATKVLAFILVPFIIFRMPFRYWLICAGVFFGLYLPFLLHHKTDLLVLGTFAEQWLFNPSLFSLVSQVLPDNHARLFCLGIFTIFWVGYFFRYHRPLWRNKLATKSIFSHTRFRGDWLLGLFLLLSPVMNPWYLIWLLPFAVIHPSYWIWTFATTAALSYLTGLNMANSDLQAYEVAQWATVVEYGSVMIAILVTVALRNNKTEKIQKKETEKTKLER